MPHQRRSLRKRKLSADVSSDECDDDGDNCVPMRLQNDFPADDAMQHRNHRKRRTSVQNPQPKSERQQVALFRRLEAANADGPEMPPASSPFVTVGTSVKRRGRVKNINWRDRHGETVLHKLVTYGTVEQIEQLIRQGADVNARDNADWTALHEASLKGLPDAVECLLKAGADVNVAADGGTTPLHDGAISGCLKDQRSQGKDGGDKSSNFYREVVELLLQHGADASRTDKSCCTPLEVSTSDEVRSCLLDHLRRTTESSEAKDPGSSENASYSDLKSTVVGAQPDRKQSILPGPQCSALITPPLERSTLDRWDRSFAKETADRNARPLTRYGPYADQPGSLPEGPSHSSSLDVFRARCPALISPVTTSRTVSASSSAMTLSSTSVAASPSTSAFALSRNLESGRRVMRSGSRSFVETSDEVFQAGVAEIGSGGDTWKGNGNMVSSGKKSECRGLSSLPKDDESLDRARAALPCPVIIYEDISDDDDDYDDVSLLSCSVETSVARPKELVPQHLCFAMNSNKQNEDAVNSVVVPSSQMPGGLVTGEVSTDNLSSAAFGLHSYSQTEHSGRLPAGWFKELRWKTSNCAASVGSGAEERDAVWKGLGGILGGGDESKMNPSPGKRFARSRISDGCGVVPVFSGHRDLSEESSGKNPRDVPSFSNRLIRGACVQGDSGISRGQKNGNSMKKQIFITRNVQQLGDLGPYRVEPQSSSGLGGVACIPRSSADDPGESNVVTNCPDLALNKLNDDSRNSLGISSKNGCRRAEVPVDRSSDKPKLQGGKSEGAQSVALKKLGRDVVVFLRRAALDVRPEAKQFGFRKATGIIGEDMGHTKTSHDKVQAEAATISGTSCQKDRGLFTSNIGGLEMDAGDGVKQRFNLCRSPLKKESVPSGGSIPQKERVFDWNRPISSSALLVDKSTMTAESDWELNESVAKDESTVVMPGNFMDRSAVETQTNITGEESPFAVRDVVPEPCAFQMCSGDWKTSAHPLCSLYRLSGPKKTLTSQSVGAVGFGSTHKPETLGFDGLVESCDRITSLPLLASYKTMRRPRQSTDSACNARHDQNHAGSGFAAPTGTCPGVSACEEPPTKARIISFCESEKVLDFCASGSFGGGIERTDCEVSEMRCRPFGKRFKALTETSSSCRKEPAATVSGVGKNAGARKKNTKNDRVNLEEDVPSELHMIGSETTDCGRPTASMRRAAGFGGGIASGCSSLGKAKGQTRVAKEKDLLVQMKANVLREACSGEQSRDGDDASHSKKTSNYVLWHGLCSKPCGSLEAVVNDERKMPAAREKPHFPKDFERFLMATREYGSHSSNEEMSAPPGLDLPLKTLFIKQEKERLKLKQEQHMRWERLLLTIEAEVLREYVEEEKRLDAFRPQVSSCSVLCQQNFCSRSHESLLETTHRPENSLKSRLKGLREKFLEFEEDMHFQLQNEISVLHACQVQEWERMVTSCQPVNLSNVSPQLCVLRVGNLRCLVSAFFDKLNLYQ